MQKDSNQWPQNYQEILDTIDPDLNSDGPFDFNPSPTRSTLSPKASIGKPIKRRSRASKKTPTTLLKADADNFRALVQQFTGLQSGVPAFGSYKGPINLNFEQCTYYYTKSREAVKTEAKAKQKQKQLINNNKQHSYNNNDLSIDSAAINILEDDEDDDDDDEELSGARAETLTIDGYDVEDIWRRAMSESGDYSTVLPWSIDDGFWGY